MTEANGNTADLSAGAQHDKHKTQEGEESVIEVRKKLRELTKKIIDGDESASTQAEFDRMGRVYDEHVDKELSDEQAANKYEMQAKLKEQEDLEMDLDDEI